MSCTKWMDWVPWWIALGFLFGGGGVPVRAQSGRTDPTWRRVGQAQLRLAVRAHPKLALFVRRDAQARPLLEGWLRDDRNRGIGEEWLSLWRPDGRMIRWKTRSNGRFQIVAMSWPARGVYRISFAGNRRFGPVSLSRTLDLGRVDLDIKVSAPSALPAGSRRFALTAWLSYQGHPLRGVPLTLLGQQPGATEPSWPLMSLRSDQQGALRFVWEGAPLQGPATLSFALSFPGNESFLPQRHRLRLVILAPPSADDLHVFWSFALGIALLLSLGGLSIPLWRVLRRKRVAKRARIHLPEVGALLDEEGDLEAEGVLAKEDFGIAGRCVGEDGVAVEGAYVLVLSKEVAAAEEDERLLEGQILAQVKSGPKGGFVLEGLPKGIAQLRVYHPHFRTKSARILLPHRGAGRRLELHLLSYRQLIWEAFLDAAKVVAPEHSFDPKLRTARELLAALSATQAAQLRPIAALFEESYYGPRPPDASLYAEAITYKGQLQQGL